MKAKRLPDLGTVSETLSYNPTSGEFHWLVSRGPVAAGSRAGSKKNSGYRAIQIYDLEYLEHRLAWLIVYGSDPHSQVDHRNLIRDDNRISNLRLATPAQQQANTSLQSNNKHGSKGIKWREDNKRWRAEIYVNGRAVNVGSFTTKEAAASAYAEAAVKYYGEFARP
jgi:hypothetical protein